jgi:RNA polymerase sigma-70 factor (ECF subfamily)
MGMNVSDKEISQFIGKFQDKVFRTCLGFVQNADDALDLTQDVFLSVLESLASFRNESQLSTWVYRIAVNKSLNHLKKRKTRSIMQSLDLLLFKKEGIETHEHVHNPIIESENRLEVSKMLQYSLGKLPENQRIAFTLSKYEDLDSSEIAGIMNISVSAVDSLLHRAKLNMQKSLQSLRY